MGYLIDFIFGVLRTVLRLTMFVFVSVFVLGLLFLGLTAALLAVLWSLLTGRKPTAWTTFMRFRQASRQFQQGVWRGQSNPNRANDSEVADVVDVQVKEVSSAIEHKP